MDIVTMIKNLLGIRQVLPHEQVQRLKKLPKEQALKELGTVLYEECVRQASTFVNGELRRGDTPFKGMSAATFFHEILAVSFWVVDQEAAGGKKLLVKEFHDNYFRSFSMPVTLDERHNELMKKYEKYDDAWNEVTGHFDEFGLQVVHNLYGKGEDIKTRERTFWVIRFADDIVKACKPLKKSWKIIGLAPEKKAKVAQQDRIAGY
jgi:phage terminase large subunit-like protein